MPRRKEFDPEEAMARAVEVFRRKGYAATTTDDLTKAMRIGRGSLFSTFGTKDEIFFAALRAYEERVFGGMTRALDGADDPLACLRHMLLELARREGGRGALGCLVVNTTIELGPNDKRIARYLRARWRLLEDAFSRALSRGGLRGDARAVARFLVMTLRGAAVAARLQEDGTHLREAMRVAVTTLEARAARRTARAR